MADIIRRYNMGLNQSTDPTEIGEGEMTTATGVWYKPGDHWQVHKFGGRSSLWSPGVGTILGMQPAFGAILVAGSSSIAMATTSGTPVSISGGTISAERLIAAHADDRIYLAVGAYPPQVLEITNTVRKWGMEAPDTVPTGSATSAGTLQSYPTSPTDDTSGFTNTVKAYDGDDETYASNSKNSAGTTSVTYSGWGSNAGSNRYLKVTWSLAVSGTASQQEGTGAWPWQGPGPFGSGGNLPLGFKTTVTLAVSFTGTGGTYFNLVNGTFKGPKPVQTATIKVPDTSPNLTAVAFKATHTYVSGTKLVTLRIHEVIVTDAPATTFDAVNVGYAVAEYSETYDIQSVPGPTYRPGAWTAKSGFLLTLPTAAKNAITTHWIVYRTPDEGTDQQLFLVDKVPLTVNSVTQTTYLDTFSKYAVDSQGETVVPQIAITTAGLTVYMPRDLPPPAFDYVAFWRGHLVGIDSITKRRLHYSVGGYPDSFPATYVVANLPLEEYGQLMALTECGSSLVVGATSGMMRIDDLPTASDGEFEAAEPVQIKGAPGIINRTSLTTVRYEGQSQAAWVAEDGVYITDGHIFRKISQDLDWSAYVGTTRNDSTFGIRWIKSMSAILLWSNLGAAPTNVYYLLHLSREHVKPDGRAKVTGPHYGNLSFVIEIDNSGTNYVFSAAGSTVYREFNPSVGTDAQNAANGKVIGTVTVSGSQLPLALVGKRSRIPGYGIAIQDCWLVHGAFGSGQTATAEMRVGRYASGTTLTRTQTVSLSSNFAETQFDIARSGDHFQETIVHTGDASSGSSPNIKSLRVRARQLGHEGKVA